MLSCFVKECGQDNLAFLRLRLWVAALVDELQFTEGEVGAGLSRVLTCAEHLLFHPSFVVQVVTTTESFLHLLLRC